MNNSWISKSWEEYYIAPGAGRKLYVLRRRGQSYWLDQHYNERTTDFDHKIQTLGKNLDECKIKADKLVGKDNYKVEEGNLGLIKQTKDERRHFKFPNGRFMGNDISELDLSNKNTLDYTIWWWSNYKNTKSYGKFYENLHNLLIDSNIIVEYNDEFLTKKDYDYRIKKEEWKKQSEEQSKLSNFVGEVKKRIESEIKMVFSIKAGESIYGDFYITKYIDNNNNTIMLKGSYPSLTDKECFHKVKFTVKEHTEYKGEKQTIVQRIYDYGEIN